MEKCKLSYAHSLLTRIGRKKNLGHVAEDTGDWFANETRGRSIALNQCISVIKKMEREIRESYSDPINLNSEEFIEMMVCELLTRRFMPIYTQNDPLRNNFWIKSSLKWDLLLLENQLPMFVLEHLFNLTAPDRQQLEGKCLEVLVLALFKFSLLLPDGNTLLRTHPDCRHARHILDLIAILLHPTPPHLRELKELHSATGEVGQTMRLYSSCRLVTSIVISGMKHTAAHIFTKGTATSTLPRANNNRNTRSIRNFTPSATELSRAGVKFKKGSTENGFYDIEFNNGVLEIPPLITSAEDVELLRSKGIIRNSFGSDGTVANLFNNLSCEIKYHKFYYSQLTNQVNEHYNKRRHIWKATLKREYFNSPWSNHFICCSTPTYYSYDHGRFICSAFVFCSRVLNMFIGVSNEYEL
ncbi:UPF0481 protein At3g47200-like [Papaver somniferum]|uniref:UPF0481 protein At3g47200-like n=1 Tax=Papaver somniferum TaxID=3469 RepID=UPI000E6F6010|nr:UPF0481 protein At3g47200-like [Papaver somniferum]